ncbi:hypothetical protein CR205_01000 [Alteribacter lacisalsi]|uniref:Uncharacterized protein n=1 Tax=Alteribacter lacisalsi TaxID=2045244 RepID=A0A2W0H8E6_9BACI|nr:hypothetical protein [Alteribacter lacisalsi]PYZ97211.1 hypothetical protein CR205_01000 [Alteribacter lacisalsi]
MRILIAAAIMAVMVYAPDAYAGGEEDLLLYSEITITVQSGGVEYEWEYKNPDRFEVEEGTSVKKGERAREEVTHLVTALSLSESPSAEDVVDVLKKEGWTDLESLRIVALDRDRCLFSWGWKRD